MAQIRPLLSFLKYWINTFTPVSKSLAFQPSLYTIMENYFWNYSLWISVSLELKFKFFGKSSKTLHICALLTLPIFTSTFPFVLFHCTVILHWLLGSFNLTNLYKTTYNQVYSHVSNKSSLVRLRSYLFLSKKFLKSSVVNLTRRQKRTVTHTTHPVSQKREVQDRTSHRTL